MAETESLRQVVHARAPWSAWFGIVLLFALFGVIVLAIIGPTPRATDYEETRAKKRVENLKTLREEADKALTTYGWVEKKKNKGVALFPTADSMKLTVPVWEKKSRPPGVPIPPPASAEATAGKPQA